MKILFARHDIVLVSSRDRFYVLPVGNIADSDRADMERIASVTAEQFLEARCSVKPNEQTWLELTEEVRAAWRLEC